MVVTAPRPLITRGAHSQVFDEDEPRQTGGSNVFEAVEGHVPGLVGLSGTCIGSSAVTLPVVAAVGTTSHAFNLSCAWFSHK